MSAYDELQLFYKLQPTPQGTIRDRWALAHYLESKWGNHTAKEYASALKRKAGSKKWNPISSESKEKTAKWEAGKGSKGEEEKEKPKSKGTGRGKAKQKKLPGFEGAMRETAKKSLDESLEILNLLKAKMDEEKIEIEEDKKGAHSGKAPIRDPFAVASWRAEREGHDLATGPGKKRREEIVDDIKDEGNLESKKKKAKESAGDLEHAKDKDVKKSMSLQKISPSLAGLMAAAAGWAISDDIVRAGGGSPRGEMTPQQLRDWERTVRRTMRKKDVSLDKESWEKLQKNYFDDSDLYFRKVPLQNAVNISKDHAPIPPRQGLVWDELKKKWTSPEHAGKSVVEVQGYKRTRGTGTGVHEHSIAAGRTGGKGEGSGVAGRRFRGVADAGVAFPHESKHIAGYSQHKTNTAAKMARANAMLHGHHFGGTPRKYPTTSK